MMKLRVHPFIIFFIITIILGLGFLKEPEQPVFAQIPTGTIPTVTGTPTGPIVTVKSGIGEPSVNVRSGPNVLYDAVGVLLVGQSATAKGRSPGGDWILIEYPGAPSGEGWVYGANLDITPGILQVVEPPATSTPAVTQTIDPTLAAQFIVTIAPTRLPTYTPAEPIALPTYSNTSVGNSVGPVPMGLIIVVLLTIGVLLGIFSLVQRR
jgi:hypothetical protein